MVEQLKVLLDAARWREQQARHSDLGWTAERMASELVNSLENAVVEAENYAAAIAEVKGDVS